MTQAQLQQWFTHWCSWFDQALQRAEGLVTSTDTHRIGSN